MNEKKKHLSRKSVFVLFSLQWVSPNCHKEPCITIYKELFIVSHESHIYIYIYIDIYILDKNVILNICGAKCEPVLLLTGVAPFCTNNFN